MRGLPGVVALALALALPACRSETPAADAPRLPWIAQAPAFQAPDETGTPRSLSEFLGHPIVLYFYPKDGTPGCTAEACAFRDAWDRIRATGAEVIGISMDSVESHAAFLKKLHLPFPLLSNPGGEILEAYGVSRSPKGYAARATFILDSRGGIRRIFPEMDPALQVDQVLEVLGEMKRQGL